MDYNIIIILAVIVAGVGGFIVYRVYLEQLESRITGQGRGTLSKPREPRGSGERT